MDKGRMLQFATPADTITNPANDFVNALVGSSDRAFRLLSLWSVGDFLEDGEASGQPISAAASLKDALAEALWSGRASLPVTRDGVLIGRVSRETLIAQAGRPQ